MVTLEPLTRTRLLLSSEPGSLVVEDLLPFTSYGFQVEACTIVGCGESDVSFAFTLESGELIQYLMQ